MESKYGNWTECSIDLKEVDGEVLIALLDDLPFNSFMEDGGKLLAYIENSQLTEQVVGEVQRICLDFGLSFSLVEMESRDWNAEWESNFNPVFIQDICTIIAPFHQDVEVTGKVIYIAPKMAFGTGHHHTTSGMITMMSQINLQGSKVLDFGSGTGLLAIYASIQGAATIDAIDIEAPAYDNMLENFELNDIHNVTPYLGGGEFIKMEGDYDVVLANITANVILDNIDKLSKALKTNGILLFSGFFEKNLEDIRLAAQNHLLKYDKHIQNGDWIIARFSKV
ncbi:MAG: 50S ribosomal protein L11 methyltransferase [Bacteroidetes bacterium]|nr:50S ribosomal protein L11 methyltransferase [Bacteroidota bacterium]HMT77046.1 50S ribosomal protein L11 methyltransferase [Saprospiraceae bacterium]